MKHFEIYDEHYENDMPDFVFETDCETAQECIDEFITMRETIPVMLAPEDEERFETLISKLQSGDYTVYSDEPVVTNNWPDVSEHEADLIIVSTY